MEASSLTNDSGFVRMVILADARHKIPLSRWEANEIEKFILDQICDISGQRPCFKGEYVYSEDDGAIIINTHVDSVKWLKEVIKSYEGNVLQITDIENSPKYTAKVKTTVSKLDKKAVDNLLILLEAHNDGLKTDGWRISRMSKEYASYSLTAKINSVTLLIDDSGRKILESNGFKLFVGFSTLTFELLARVKRSETTGKICDDDDFKSEDKSDVSAHSELLRHSLSRVMTS